MEIEVIKFDNLGRGIGYIDDKIVFIPKSVPGDVLKITITKENSKFKEGKIEEIIKPSKSRKTAICPYFSFCGGCDLMNISISDMLEYKLNRINDILKRNKILFTVKKIIKSEEQYNYRNKVTLKIVNGEVGYYANLSHNLIPINYCYLCKDDINDLIKEIKRFNIQNGQIQIKSNYKNELLINIESEDKIDNIPWFTDNFKISGIIQNNKCIYGDDYLIDKVGDYLFKVSYDAFFQVNPFISKHILKLIKENTISSKKVLDLYCGVGFLTFSASNKDNEVTGIEIVENAIKDAQVNRRFNNISNVNFICADTKDVLDKITHNYDTIILDPPRSGVHKDVINKIIASQINKIIYVSCDFNTLIRDLNLLNSHYEIIEFTLLDMFQNTYHVESLCVLKLK